MRKLFLVLLIIVSLFVLFSSCIIGDLYANQRIEQYKEYAEKHTKQLTLKEKRLVVQELAKLNWSNIGSMFDILYGIALPYGYYSGNASLDEIKMIGFSYLSFAGLYDFMVITAYSQPPEDWYNNLVLQVKKKIEEEKKRLEKEKEREKQLKLKYGVWYEYIKSKTIIIGMPKEVVLEILGQPVRINKTVTADVVREQWVYERYDATLDMYWPYLYLYFENGILTSWQKMD